MLNAGLPQGARMARYNRFSGLNTRKDPHSLDRSELAAFVNGWSPFDGSVSKRPGVVKFGLTEGTGTGVPAIDAVLGRFNGITYAVVLQIVAGVPTLHYAERGGAWQLLGTLGAGAVAIDAAQMFDPDTGLDTLFITDGVDIPQMWQGPGTSLTPVKTGIAGGTATIGTNPALAGGGNLIAAVAGGAAAITTILDVLVDPAGAAATVTDSLENSISIAPGGTGTIDGVQVTLGAFAIGDAGKTGDVTVDAAHAYLPNNATNTAPITPKYVATLGNNSHLFYSGEPSAPTSVYVSNPNFPERFESASMAVSPYEGDYNPALIGQNDGVAGGDITGMKSAQGAMVVFKQSANYKMVMQVVLGEIPVWQVIQIDDVGCLAPKSIRPFDVNGSSQIGFMGIDGLYVTDASNSHKITGSVPTFFDSSLSGDAALCTDRTSAIVARHANRLLCSFAISGVGYNEGFAWFDFDRQDARGNPMSGQAQNLNASAMCALRGPADDGNVLLCDATADRIGIFGIGFADFDAPIAVTVVGKADAFEDMFEPVDRKVAAVLWLLVSVPPQSVLEGLNFTPFVITDALAIVTPSIAIAPVIAPSQGAWDIGEWDQMLWSGGGDAYFAIKVPLQACRGRVMQVGIQESSSLPWTLLGYELQINEQQIDI